VRLDLDKATWARVAFGDVVRNVNEAIKDASAAHIDRVIAMEHMDPGELYLERWGHIADGTTFTRRVTPGQTLFGKRRAYQRKVAYAEFDAICSGDIYTFEADQTRMLSQFLPLLVRSEPFFDHALKTSAGSLSPRTNWRDLAFFAFDLPPLDEQRRIADMLWAIERHRSALATQAAVIRQLIGTVTLERLNALPDTKLLGDLTTTRSGPSFAASDVHNGPITGTVPVLGIPNTKPDGTVDLHDVGYVSGLAASVARVDNASLVLIRTNGNRERIGNVYLPPAEASGYAVSAFQFLMQVKVASDRDFIYWVLSEPGMQRRMSDAASGSVGLGNLAVRWLNEQEIPWSTVPEDRAALVEECRLLTSVVDYVNREHKALTDLRSRVQAEVFGGN
jgi:type I restriction enzyme S subunit